MIVKTLSLLGCWEHTGLGYRRQIQPVQEGVNTAGPHCCPYKVLTALGPQLVSGGLVLTVSSVNSQPRRLVPCGQAVCADNMIYAGHLPFFRESGTSVHVREREPPRPAPT